MDINKIISSANKKAVKDIADGKFSSLPVISDETVASFSKQDTFLMNYFEILITAYHEELKKTLAEQGINI